MNNTAKGIAEHVRRQTISRLQARINELQGVDADATVASILTVRMSKAEHLRAKRAAQLAGLSLNQFCVAAIAGFVADVLTNGGDE